MTMRCLLMMASILAVTAVAGAASAEADRPAEAMVVAESHATRPVDCGGRDLHVTGSDNTLKVANCNVISIIGSRNRVQAKLMPDSTIAALGNSNHIVFQHSPGIEVQVSSTGADNQIVPQMGTPDLQPSPPARSLVQHR